MTTLRILVIAAIASILLFLAGCNTPPARPSSLVPGDLVTEKDAKDVGLVIRVHQGDEKWRVEVGFYGLHRIVDERNLTKVGHLEWSDLDKFRTDKTKPGDK